MKYLSRLILNIYLCLQFAYFFSDILGFNQGTISRTIFFVGVGFIGSRVFRIWEKWAYTIELTEEQLIEVKRSINKKFDELEK